MDLSRQTNTITPQQINFIRKLEEGNGATKFFIAEKLQNYFKLFFRFIRCNRII